MPMYKRAITWGAILIQGYAIWFALSRPQVWVWMWRENKIPLFLGVFLLYLFGERVMHGMVTSEIVRKAQLEADQIAAREIQQTLQPGKLQDLPGYELQGFYKPLREVGGDYFDVIDLSENRSLFILADVSGKGMPAALLAANIQALVRIIASVESSPLAMAQQINKHLSRYTPLDRFATAVFLVLNRDSGELTYVNAGHNAPLVSSSGGSTIFLEATGLPLGLYPDAKFEARTTSIDRGATLLLFSDGLTDSIQGEYPENRLRDAIAGPACHTMDNLKLLIDPKFNEDDVTILLVKRG